MVCMITHIDIFAKKYMQNIKSLLPISAKSCTLLIVITKISKRSIAMLLKDAKILIGDDSILARKQLKDVLSSMGATRFIEAVNGKEAVEKYISEKPDIVFLDIIMPIKDGITAVKEIIAENAAAQIIIVSSVGTQQQLKSAIEAGAKDFIQKPINADQIKTIVSAKFD